MNVVGVGLLLVFMRRDPGLAAPRQVVASLFRILLASAAAGAAGFGVWAGLDALLGRELWAQILTLTAGLGAAALVYLGAARLFGVRELDALRALRRS